MRSDELFLIIFLVYLSVALIIGAIVGYSNVRLWKNDGFGKSFLCEIFVKILINSFVIGTAIGFIMSALTILIFDNTKVKEESLAIAEKLNGHKIVSYDKTGIDSDNITSITLDTGEVLTFNTSYPNMEISETGELYAVYNPSSDDRITIFVPYEYASER